jgi:lactate dehydrogenase-like 2-hydroxyacid dehydrogenase
VVVNAACGSLVDDDALIPALRSGRIAAAGLDVYNGEPHMRPEYRALPNVFVLPHLGTATIETRTLMVCAVWATWALHWMARHQEIC